MSAIAQFSIPGEPIAWARAGRGRGGISYTPARQRGYGEVIRFAALEAMHGAAPAEGALRLIVSVRLPIPASWSKKKQADAALGRERPAKKPDWDNAGKIVSDALNGIVYRDDAQIVEASVSKHYDISPRLDVLVARIPASTLNERVGL